jgi:transcriptional regulator with XRE-family HTH domain
MQNGPDIKAARIALGVNAKDLAKVLGITPEHLSRIENGRVPVTTMLKLAVFSALEAVPVMKEALEDIGIYGCGMLNQPIELNQPPEQWMQKRIERMEQVARQALAALEGK